MQERNSQERSSDEDDVIDLRGLVRTLLSYKWWIIAITAGAVVAAFLAVQFGAARNYQARALVVFGQPPLNVGGIEAPAASSNVNASPFPLPDSKGITDLATADDMLYGIYNSPELDTSRAHGLTFGQFKQQLSSQVSGTSQLLLQVTASDPKEAALVANLWAQTVASRLNALYGSSSTMVTALEQQVRDSQQAWNATEKALLDYLPQSNVDALTAQLAQEQIAYNSQLARVQNMDLLLSDGRALSERLTTQQADAALSSSDALSLLLLKQRASSALLCYFQTPAADNTNSNTGPAQTFNCTPDNGLAGLQIQILGSNLSTTGNGNVADAQQELKAFMDSLAAQQAELRGGLAQKEKQLSDLRVQTESAQFHVNQLAGQRDLAEAAYKVLFGQLASTRIEVAAGGQVARVAGQASPITPAVPNRLMVTMLTVGFLAFILAIMGVIAVEWWRSPRVTSKSRA